MKTDIRKLRTKRIRKLELKFTSARRKCPDLQDRLMAGIGNPCAKIVFVMDAPTNDDEAERVSFSSQSSSLLKKLLVKAGLKKSKVYLTYAVKFVPKILRRTYRHGDTRSPSDDELAAFTPSLLEELAIVKPRIIVAVGGTAVRMLIDSTAKITEVRGRVHDSPLVDYPIMPILHPAFMEKTGGAGSRFFMQSLSDIREAKRIAYREKVNASSRL